MEYTEKDLSQWFDFETQKPWAVGVYEVDSDFGYITGHATSYWDGDKWHFTCNTTADAYKNKDLPTFDKIVKWRGLNQNPSTPKPKANKRKTMHVVVNVRTFRPCAAFDKVNEARDYAERVHFPVRVIRTRFRVPA